MCFWLSHDWAVSFRFNFPNCQCIVKCGVAFPFTDLRSDVLRAIGRYCLPQIVEEGAVSDDADWSSPTTLLAAGIRNSTTAGRSNSSHFSRHYCGSGGQGLAWSFNAPSCVRWLGIPCGTSDQTNRFVKITSFSVLKLTTCKEKHVWGMGLAQAPVWAPAMLGFSWSHVQSV